MSVRFSQLLPNNACQALAEQCGFQQRKPRKITPAILLKALGAAAFTCGSFEALASMIGIFNGTPVSKQAVAKRFSDSCVEFVQNALLTVVSKTAGFDKARNHGLFKSFARVLLQDSTSIHLHPSLAAAFPGNRNQSGTQHAVAKIQTVYDLLNESFLTFALTPFTRNDQGASHDFLSLLKPGDLLLRDLGYFVLSAFMSLNNRGIFFLSRLRYGVHLLDRNGNQFNLLSNLRRYGTLDVSLHLGKKEKVPVRLVAVPLPQSVADTRRRKAKQNRDKRCRPSKERLQLLGWEIFITNVSSDIWSAQDVSDIYGLRWRIETIFKAWKSHFRIDQLPKGSPNQIHILIYSRLLFISIFQTVFGTLANHFQQTYGQSLSLMRFSRFFSNYSSIILALVNSENGRNSLESLILHHCCYSKRKDRTNHAQNILSLS